MAETRNVPSGAVVREQRDRFLGFAFAAGDLLAETQEDGRIRYAADLTRTFCPDAPERLVGTSFYDLLAPSDRIVARALVGSIQTGGRFPPVWVRMADPDRPAALLGGCGLPDRPGVVYLSLTADRGAARHGGTVTTALLEGEDFTRQVQARLLEHPDPQARVTLVALDKLHAVQQRLAEEAAHNMPATIGYFLAMTAGAQAVGRLAPDRYAVLHGGGCDEARLCTALEQVIRALDPRQIGAQVRAGGIAVAQPGMSSDDAARALVYCINRFAEREIDDLSVTSLRRALDAGLKEAAKQVAECRMVFRSGDFDLAFQPVVDLRSRQVHHYEALARFRDHASPAQLVAFAEETRMVVDLDLAVCSRVVRLIEDGKLGGPIAVNLSGRSLVSSLFTQGLLAMLESRRHLAPRLLFEITETAVITDLARARAVIQALQQGGFRICLDDFGAGANSFHYLRTFPVDFVKLDGAFARQALQSPLDHSLLRHIVGFCRENRLTTVAEMIEREDDAGQFARLGIDLGQGYLFGKPRAELPAPAIAGEVVWTRGATPSQSVALP